MKKSLVLNLLIGVLCLCQLAIAAEDQWQGVDRIVAVGDIHGDYDNYIQVLRDAGLVNRRGNWIAGESHFVQLGDLPDRGPDTDKIIAHMKKLEIQAAADGGRVHALIGNHEAMNIYGDLRYVDPGEYEALKSRDARPLRNAMYALHLQQLQAANPEFKVEEDYREKFDAQYPLGFVEHRRSWDVRQGEFGSWVAEHNAVIKINRTLFLHGGISSQYVQMSLAEINEQVRSELAGNLLEDRLGASEAEDGPLWYRGLANNDELLEKAHLESVLVKYDVDHIVIGHTPGLGTIVPRFGGKVLVIDSGISKSYGGHLASLLIENGKLKTLQEGKEIALPEENAGLFAYYQSILALGSNTVALQRLVDSMQQEP
ncbi:MAG: metallophosphoesterase [Pseudohongiella sp.]|nr:metallophosphoesterase [Pseudohongiella sp.]